MHRDIILSSCHDLDSLCEHLAREGGQNYALTHLNHLIALNMRWIRQGFDANHTFRSKLEHELFRYLDAHLQKLVTPEARSRILRLELVSSQGDLQITIGEI